MKKCIIMAMLPFTTFAATESLSINVTTQVEYKTITTYEACAITVDPSWSHEEDTSVARSVLKRSSYVQVKKVEEQGFKYYGLKDNEKCSLDSENTFEYLKNPKPMNGYIDNVFYYATSGTRLAQVAEEANAFKKVERIYIKGVKNFQEAVKAETSKEVNALIQSLK